MRGLRRSGLALVAATILVALPTAPRPAEPGACVVVWGADHAAVATAARRALGVPAQTVDVKDRRRRDDLAARCGRLVIAVGSDALRVARESAPDAPLVHVMAPEAPASEGPGVATEPDPRRVLETLRTIAPRARRVGAVYDSSHTGELVAHATEAARALGIELVALPVRSVGEAVRAFHRFETDVQVDALWLLPDGTATVQETVYYALELAHWRRMAVIGVSRWYVASGALFALLPTPESYGTAAGELGRDLLRGTPPRAVVHARDHVLYVNQRAAARLGLKVPRDVLMRAEQVLQ